jgi:Immunoglobulin I-set domain
MKKFLLLFAVFALTLSASVAQNTPVPANVGKTVTFSVTNGGTPPFTYQWRFNAANIAGATASTYVITSAKLTDAGSYDVIVSNSAGSTTSDQGILTVNAPPAITQQPAGNQTVPVGLTAIFSVTATGTPAPSFQWRKNGVNITGATASTFTIAAVQLSDAANYDCVITNAGGSATSSISALTVSAVIPSGAKILISISPGVGG